MQFDKIKTVCFSGYRPQKFGFELTQNQQYENLMMNIFNECVKAAEQRYDTFIIGGCSGFDILCSEVIPMVKSAYNNDLKMVCALPYENFCDSKHFDAHWHGRYEAMIEKCDMVINVSGKANEFNGCYQRRNEFMVDNSSLLICYHTGKGGGTANTIMYALRSSVEIRNIANLNSL